MGGVLECVGTTTNSLAIEGLDISSREEGVLLQQFSGSPWGPQHHVLHLRICSVEGQHGSGGECRVSIVRAEVDNRVTVAPRPPTNPVHKPPVDSSQSVACGDNPHLCERARTTQSIMEFDTSTS